MFRKSRLSNGMTVLTETIGHVRSVSLGIWVRTGSRAESPSERGISHFLEHMFFKGTARRDAHRIAVDIDSLGGEMNAFTSKENTTFYVKVLDEHIEKGIELLADIFLNSTFPEDEIEREKGVITEEIRMVEDSPEEYIHDLFSESTWGVNGLGGPVLGTEETVSSIGRQGLLGYQQRRYGTDNTIISCAGNIDADTVMNMLEQRLGVLGRESSGGVNHCPEFHAELNVREAEYSEAHICLGVKGIPQGSGKRFEALLVNTVFGGGMSSRLFQEIREKRGLAYSVYSFLNSFTDTGAWMVYAGTSPESVNEVIDMTRREWASLGSTMSEAELDRAKAQLKGNIMLGLESTSRRMQSIANQEIYYGQYYTPDEVMRMIDGVTLGQARDVAVELYTPDAMAACVLGPVKPGSVKAV